MFIPAAFLAIVACQICTCARILCVFSTPALSHLTIFYSITQKLALRGHHLTIVTPNALIKNQTNIEEIEIPTITEIARKNGKRIGKPTKHYSLFSTLTYIAHLHSAYIEEILSRLDTVVANSSYDLLIVESFLSLLNSLRCRFKIPTIGLRSSLMLSYDHLLLGNPTHPLLYPDLSPRNEISFLEKVTNIFNALILNVNFFWSELPRTDKIAKKYFGDQCPYIEDLMKSVSITLTNTNLLLHEVHANIPTIVEIGGLIHIQDEKPLPHDLQTFLDKNPKGVVYFGVGCIRKSIDLPENVRNVIIQALSELPYKVLLKWELDELPNQPKNIMIKKWLPQQDVLRHPNIKVFVNHGGLLSVEEAIANTVPIVAMPLAVDQPTLAAKMVEMGIGINIDYANITKDHLKNAILEVAENRRYKRATEKLKKLIQDQHMTSLEKAIWWIEYVIRHNDSTHLNGPSRYVVWYERFYLDMVLVGFVTFCIGLFVIIVTIQFLKRFISRTHMLLQ